MAESHAPQPAGEEASERQLVGSRVGRFAIRARVGSGGMGEVYEAFDPTLNRPVALKRISPRLRADAQYRGRLLKEAKRASSVSDPNIAGIYDVIEESGELFLIMEYVEGKTLRRRLEAPLDIPSFLAIAVQCATALRAAHQRGVVHCDIKPDNIMITPAGRVKILDFGLAKYLPGQDENETLETLCDEKAGFGGTPAYMAPEVLLRKPFDGRADIFSLGIVFYEALAARNPFRAGGVLATAQRIINDEPEPLRGLNRVVPPELEAIVMKMLAKRASERYAGAPELLADLQALQSGSSPSAALALARPAHRLPLRRAAVALAAVLVVLAALLAAVPLLRHQTAVWLGFRMAIPERKHLAVLPFINVGGDPANQAFCDGLTYLMTSKLTQLEQFHGALFVVPASELVNNKVKTPREARAQFGVNLVVTGSMQRTGDRVRLTADLVDAASLRQLRSLTLDGNASDPALLQDGVAARISELLEVELQPEAERALAARGTGVARAHDYYLQGRGYLQNYDKPENIENAIAVLRQALELDSNYALAYAGLGEAYWRKYEHTRDSQWVQPARENCERAARLDEAVSRGHVCLGTLYLGTGKYEEAVQQFQRATELEPTSDEAHRGLALAYERLGKMKEAEWAYQRAISLRPSYWAGYSWLGAFYFHFGRYPDAARMFAQVVQLAPDSFLGYRNLGAIYYSQGRYAEAVAMFERSVAIRPTARAYSNMATAYFNLRRFAESARTYEQAAALGPRDYLVYGNLGDAYSSMPDRRTAALGAYQKAIALAEQALQVNPRDASVASSLGIYYAMSGNRPAAESSLRRSLDLAPGNPQVLFNAALVCERLGQRGRALDFLEKAAASGYSLADIRDTPVLDNLRSEPRFQALLRTPAVTH